MSSELPLNQEFLTFVGRVRLYLNSRLNRRSCLAYSAVTTIF